MKRAENNIRNYFLGKPNICTCGANAQCDENQNCKCLPNYFGDPNTFCRPECTTNSECSRTQACINQRCKDPCDGTCGNDARCNVVNHIPMCSCPTGMTGDPFSRCVRVLGKFQPKRLISNDLVVTDIVANRMDNLISETPSRPEPCSPSPCGPNSVCKVVEDHAVCSCLPTFIGAPPACRPECVVTAGCPLDQACLNNKCVDPCPGSCGQNAKCQTINHNPICSCFERYTGDPFVNCYPIGKSHILYWREFLFSVNN